MTSKLISRSQCPECKKNGRDTSEDNLGNYDDGHSYCFACGYYHSESGGDVDDSKCTFEYLPYRGLTKTTLEFYGVKTKVSPDGTPIAVGFRMPNGSYKVRNLAHKDFRIQGDWTKPGLFGRDKFSEGGHKYVTITEGYEDALSLYQVLKSPVVSVHSAASAASDASVDRSWLNSYERIYLALDNDGPGREAASAIARLFDFNKVYLVKFSKYKDANEYLVSEPEGESELRNIWWNSRKYLPVTIKSSQEDFKKILEEAPKQGVPYPFPTLSDMTFGIRTGESVLITAQEGIGKTEIMHAIEYQLLKETKDAVGAIFLEEPEKRHLQAIAGIELKRPVHLPENGCTQDQVYSALQKVVGADDRLYVYSHFGSNDPEDLLDTVRFLVGRGCRYILLDHISMAVSGLSGEDERKALDYLSTRLEMMVKELDFSLIMVSHVNDEGRTRGSRYISKIADIRIDATRDVTNPDPVERNTTYLVVAKNRYSGRTGPAGHLIFDPRTYILTEIGAANDETSWNEGRVA